MTKLPEGFNHAGDGRLSVSNELLERIKTSQDLKDVYEIEESWIAKGMYGIVKSALSKQSGITYAAKFLRRRRRGQCCLNEINHEIAVLMLCADSSHVVKLEAVHEARAEIALILELATGGELQTLIDDQGHLSEQKTRVCMREILRALQHMHNKSIAHLDLKPQNILLAGQDVEDGLKLCDFGIARFIGERNKIYEIIGTPDYVAPEVLHYDPLSLQTDIWSIGVVAYVLLTGLSPFGGESKQETFLNVTKCSLTFPDDLFAGISSDAIDFMKSTLRIKPRERLTVDECLGHRWLQEERVRTSEEMLAAQLMREVSVELNGAATGDESSGAQQFNERASPADKLTAGSGTDRYSFSGCHHQRAAATKQPLLVDEKAQQRPGTMPLLVAEVAEDQQQQTTVERLRRGASKMEEASEPDTAPGKLGAGKGSAIGGSSGAAEVLAGGDDNKENVMVAGNGTGSGGGSGGSGVVVVGSTPPGTTCSLFPDAPTTPKVSRKALPAEQLSDHHSNHHHSSGNGHHFAHHMHHHHHHLHHMHATNGHTGLLHHHQNLSGYGNGSSQASVIFSAASTGGGNGTVGNGLPHTTARHNCTSSSVKSFVQMFQSHQQQQQAQTANATPTNGVVTVAPAGTSTCTTSALVVITSTVATDEATTIGSPTSESRDAVGDASAMVDLPSSSPCCRTGTSLCDLKCNEASSVVRGIATVGSLTPPGRKTLQQCDKDVIIC